MTNIIRTIGARIESRYGTIYPGDAVRVVSRFKVPVTESHTDSGYGTRWVRSTALKGLFLVEESIGGIAFMVKHMGTNTRLTNIPRSSVRKVMVVKE